MRKEALAEFAHYLQFVDILMTATGVTAFIIMAGICVPHGRPTNQNPKVQHIVASAALLVKRGENEVSAKGARSRCMIMNVNVAKNPKECERCNYRPY